MRIGDTVKNNTTGEYGTVHYSTFGVSIHVFDEKDHILSKTLGQSIDEASKHWQVVDMPEGYEKKPDGGLRRKS